MPTPSPFIITEREAAAVLGVSQARISQMIHQEKLLSYVRLDVGGERIQGLERHAVQRLCAERAHKRIGPLPAPFESVLPDTQWQTLYGERSVQSILGLTSAQVRYLFESLKLQPRDVTNINGGPRTLGADIELYVLDKALVEWRQLYNHVDWLASKPKRFGQYDIKGRLASTKAEVERLVQHRKACLREIAAWQAMRQPASRAQLNFMREESARNLAEIRRRREESAAYLAGQGRLMQEVEEEFGDEFIPEDEFSRLFGKK